MNSSCPAHIILLIIRLKCTEKWSFLVPELYTISGVHTWCKEPKANLNKLHMRKKKNSLTTDKQNETEPLGT